jgi:hypothetical protein
MIFGAIIKSLSGRDINQDRFSKFGVKVVAIWHHDVLRLDNLPVLLRHGCFSGVVSGLKSKPDTA